VEVDMMIPSEAKVGRYTTKDSNLSISWQVSAAGVVNMSSACHFHSKFKVLVVIFVDRVLGIV
jgi:hypothetical protein